MKLIFLKIHTLFTQNLQNNRQVIFIIRKKVKIFKYYTNYQ